MKIFQVLQSMFFLKESMAHLFLTCFALLNFEERYTLFVTEICLKMLDKNRYQNGLTNSITSFRLFLICSKIKADVCNLSIMNVNISRWPL